MNERTRADRRANTVRVHAKRLRIARHWQGVVPPHRAINLVRSRHAVMEWDWHMACAYAKQMREAMRTSFEACEEGLTNRRYTRSIGWDFIYQVYR